jgi:hypothetical protein
VGEEKDGPARLANCDIVGGGEEDVNNDVSSCGVHVIL